MLVLSFWGEGISELCVGGVVISAHSSPRCSVRPVDVRVRVCPAAALWNSVMSPALYSYLSCGRGLHSQRPVPTFSHCGCIFSIYFTHACTHILYRQIFSSNSSSFFSLKGILNMRLSWGLSDLFLHWEKDLCCDDGVKQESIFF